MGRRTVLPHARGQRGYLVQATQTATTWQLQGNAPPAPDSTSKINTNFAGEATFRKGGRHPKPI
eukprot:13658535-Alexandrium_andersonii.AAC.1